MSQKSWDSRKEDLSGIINLIYDSPANVVWWRRWHVYLWPYGNHLFSALSGADYC